MDTTAPLSPETWPALPPLPEGEWPAQGQWRYEDYCRLPGAGASLEVLPASSDHPAPTVSHQTVARLGLSQSSTWRVAPWLVAGRRRWCICRMAEPVQPDLLYACRTRRDRHRPLVAGPPDLVVEVLACCTRLTGR